MAKISLPKSLIDDPTFLAGDWSGYFHFQDPTTLPFSVLTFPSFNCTMPSFDKIIPDKGKTLIGQIYDENVGIIGNKQKFKNLGGIEMEPRVFASLDTDLLDVIQVGFWITRLVYDTLTGTFDIGEIISGGTSGASARIEGESATTLFLTDIIGNFEIGETITGLTSGATANTVLVPEYRFHQITENDNPLPRGRHEYYFDEWFDTDLNPAESKNLPRLIWVNGYRKSGTPVKGEVYSWTGGIAYITAVTGDELTIDSTTTWRSLGFTEDASGDAYVIVNGVEYQLDDPADLDTSTIDVDDTTGISVGDIATSKIEVDEAPIPFDMCRNNKGYMFYGNWNQRDLYQSNAFNRPSTMFISSFLGGLLNDMTIPPDAVYTGTGSHVYHIVIDSVTPGINTQTFVSAGGIAGNSVFDTTGYSATGENVYKILVVADSIITLVAGVGTYTDGEIVIGNTTGAILRVVAGGDLAGGAMYTQTVSGIPIAGETLTGQTSGTTRTILIFQYSVLAAGYKNGVLQTGLPFPFNFFGGGYVQLALVGTYSFMDGLVFDFNTVDSNTNGDYWELTIQTAAPDTFQWWIDSGTKTNLVEIDGTDQSLSDGVEIQFGQTTGHALGDAWTIQVDQSITRAWVNFYYTLPIRKPGEGYKYRLPSNFWTMDTQEESMYINGSYGEWSVVDTILSADLQSETVSLAPLKQAGANKVLYPYLTGHSNDKLLYINTEHSLDTIGREQFLEKPQTGYLSDPVKLDFLASSFKGGRIKYFGKRIYITSPEDGIMHCFDTFKNYWQPPKKFPEMGILSIIGDNLVAHSNVRNQTFTMFTNSNGDNGQAYEVSIRTPYTALGDRWGTKWSNMSFTEGYIQGNPKLVHTVYLGVEGCGGAFDHPIEPIVCVIPDRAPFGEGSFGSHPNGSDLAIEGSYFQEIYKAYSPTMEWYFLSLGITCVAKSHTWSLLTLGMNAMEALSGNNKLTNKSNLAKNNP